MELLAGLDLGTSAFKGVVVNLEGRIVASARAERSYRSPALGWMEEDPEDFRGLLFGLLRELAERSRGAGEISALASASASGDSIFLDSRDHPIGAIRSWMDRRAVEEIGSLLPDLDLGALYDMVGWPWDPRFPVAQTAWLRRHDPAAFSLVARLATDADYAAFLLCGKWGIDVSSAASLYLLDQRKPAWDATFLGRLGLKPSALSPLLPSGASLGPIAPSVAEVTGLPASCLMRLGAFDHACAARGSGLLSEGDILLSCGTSWVLAMPVADRQRAMEAGMLVDLYLRPTGLYLALLDMGEIGGDIDRKRKAAGFSKTPHEDFDASAEGEAPLTPGGARELMERAAFAVRKGLRFLAERGYGVGRIRMAGGPSNSPVWTRIVASVLGRELELSQAQYAGAIGAAVLAGMGKFHDEAEASARFSREHGTMAPEPSWADAYRGTSE